MNLSKETLEKLAELDTAREAFERIRKEANELIERDTDNLFCLCLSDLTTHMWYDNSKGTTPKTKQLLRDIVDDAALDISWQDAYMTCYKFNIDRQKCIILLRNVEEASNDA